MTEKIERVIFLHDVGEDSVARLSEEQLGFFEQVWKRRGVKEIYHISKKTPFISKPNTQEIEIFHSSH